MPSHCNPGFDLTTISRFHTGTHIPNKNQYMSRYFLRPDFWRPSWTSQSTLTDQDEDENEHAGEGEDEDQDKDEDENGRG